MSYHISLRCLFLSALVLGLLSSCSGASQDGASAVEDYYRALVAKEVNQMINASCAAWEEEARREFNSFAAVELNMQSLDCSVTRQEGDQALVSCNGSVIASYGEEDLDLDIQGRTFLVVNEGGEWRMCGYE